MLERRSRPSEPRVYRDAVFLSGCSIEEAREWLANRPISYSSTRGTPETPPDAPVLEYLLLRRNDPQIDLSLAEFGRCRSVLERVYKRGNASTKAVACSNASLFVGDKVTGYSLIHSKEPLFWDVIHKGSLAELRALCENPDLSSGMYEALITSWVGNDKSHVDEALRTSDKRFMQIVRFLSENPRLLIDRDESRERHYLDGYSEYQYGILARECWRLAEIVPVNDAWAYCLWRLYSKMKPAYKPYEDVSLVLERWRPDQEVKYAQTKSLREILAVHYVSPNMDSLTSEDEALRRAFYRTFDPDQEEFRDLDWMKWREQDEYCEHDLHMNEKIWRSHRGRRKLKQFLWDASEENSDLTNIGWFREQEEIYRKEHPEWFIEDEEDFEDTYDDDAAQKSAVDAVTTANAIHGAGTFAAEATSNDMIGQRILREELGQHGTKGLPVYNLDDRTRDRLIAHARQDVAASFGHAKSAFRSAVKAEKAAKRSNALLWVVVVLLVYIVLFG